MLSTDVNDIMITDETPVVVISDKAQVVVESADEDDQAECVLPGNKFMRTHILEDEYLEIMNNFSSENINEPGGNISDSTQQENIPTAVNDLMENDYHENEVIEIAQEENLGENEELDISNSNLTPNKHHVKILKHSRSNENYNEMSKLNLDMDIPIELWKKIFDLKTKKFKPKIYNNVISELLTEITGCLINIKSKDISKHHITIRTYCGHSRFNGKETSFCGRKYVIINKNIIKGTFQIFTNNAMQVHTYKKARVISGFKRNLLKEILLHNSAANVYEKLTSKENPVFLNEHETLQVNFSYYVKILIKVF